MQELLEWLSFTSSTLADRIKQNRKPQLSEQEIKCAKLGKLLPLKNE